MSNMLKSFCPRAGVLYLPLVLKITGIKSFEAFELFVIYLIRLSEGKKSPKNSGILEIFLYYNQTLSLWLNDIKLDFECG